MLHLGKVVSLEGGHGIANVVGRYSEICHGMTPKKQGGHYAGTTLSLPA